MRSKCPPSAHLSQGGLTDSRRRRCRRRTPLRTRVLAAAMREEAPREQQDRRAYISKKYMAGWAGFIDIPGGSCPHRGETWGKTSFRDSKVSERQPCVI